MKRHNLPTSMPWLLNVHPGNPHGLRFAEGDGGEQGAGSGEQGGNDGEAPKAPPWERKGEEFDAEKAKTYIASLQREAEGERAKRVAAEAEVKKHENEQLSETEKLVKERDDLRSTATQRGALVDRYEVAEEVGLPLSWARRLVGDDRDALLEDAKRMKADLDERSKGSTPRHDPSQGGGRGDGRTTTSVSAAKEEYLERRRNKQR